MKIKKGDKVKIILGKDRGKVGKVERVLGKRRQVFVAGANLYKRHVKKRGDVAGGIADTIKPMDISNVSLVCPGCGKAVRVGYKLVGSEKVRICKICQKEIDDAKT